MSTPLNSYLWQDFTHYYHTYQDTWDWFDPCVISYTTSSAAGTFFHVHNDTRQVRIETYDPTEVGTHSVPLIAYYSLWTDHDTPPNTHY